MTEATIPKLLVVEDDAGLQRQMKWALAEHFDVLLAGTRADALALAKDQSPVLAVIDLGLPPDPDGATEGLALLEGLIDNDPNIKVVVASGNEDRENALSAISIGAYDFYSKPVEIEALKLILQRAHYLRQLEDENRRLAVTEDRPLEGIIAASDVMLDVCRSVERVATTNVSVLIQGESGTGKEVIAKAIHDLSARRDAPFIAINCAAIPENLLESELFGHEKGSFTGAFRQYIGRAEQAQGGTLFLDEIGDMPFSLQSKLLRFLESRTVQRLGGTKDIPIDVRVVSASNRDLEGMTKTDEFRGDLYFRLNEVGLVMPPLRDRGGDITLLASFLLKKYGQVYDRNKVHFTPQALNAVRSHPWPGNIREMENRIKKAVVLADGDRVDSAALGLSDAVSPESLLDLKEARDKAEAEAITAAMVACDQNVSKAAKILGVSRPTLYNLLSVHDLKF